jgi:hypothetical protein
MALDLAPPQLAIEMPLRGPGSMDDWNSRIERAKEAIKQTRRKFEWNKQVERYVGKPLRKTPTESTVQLPKDYSYTEQKKPLLFFQLPEILLTPARPDVMPGVAELFQNVLNELTSATQLNCKAMVDEVLVDLLVPAGIGISKIGYEAFIDPLQPTRPMQVGEQEQRDQFGQIVLDPMTMQPVLEPIIVEVPNILRERYFCERLSPVDFLYDPSFRGSDWSKCSWMGGRIRMSPRMAELLYGVDSSRMHQGAISGQVPTEDESLAADRSVQQFGGVEGWEIWYHAIDVDPEVGDPDLIRMFVIFDGHRDPVVHQNSPYQTLDEMQRKVMSGLRRIPYYPVTLRYISDTPIPPSDCSQSRVIVDELSEGRSQMLKQRDRNIPQRGIDISKWSPDSREKLLAAGYQELIPFDGLIPGDKPLFALEQSAFPQENFNFNNIGERDLQECWALSGPNLGITNISGRTATELSMQQQGTETRMESERVRVNLWWIAVVEGLSALCQLFQTEESYVNVLGPDGAKQLVAWNKESIAGTFAFAMRPDSSKRVDAVSERKFRLDVYQLFRNDPLVNHQELLKWAMPSLSMNPDKMIVQPQPQPPEQPRVSLAIKGEDLSPLSPQYPNVATVMQAKGLPVGPPPGQGPQPPQPTNTQHPGAAEGIGPLNKHLQQQTGQLPGPTSAPTAGAVPPQVM